MNFSTVRHSYRVSAVLGFWPVLSRSPSLSGNPSKPGFPKSGDSSPGTSSLFPNRGFFLPAILVINKLINIFYFQPGVEHGVDLFHTAVLQG